MKKLSGFTLIELILFIVVTSILASAMMLAMNTTLLNTPSINQGMIATEAADGCMEGFIGERALLGYSNSLLACSNSPTLPSVCTAPTGYSVAATITCAPTLSGDSTTSKTVTVTVTGLGNATLTTLLAND